MKTEFLKELGLEQEQIDKIMAENGKELLQRKPKRQRLKGRGITTNPSWTPQKRALGSLTAWMLKRLRSKSPICKAT